MRISAIAAMAANGVVGRENRLPWNLPEDLKRFREITTGHPIIMGRKTYESIGRPLPKRENIVVSRQLGLEIPGVLVFGGIDEALAWCSGRTDEIFVIGGAEIWKLAWPRIDRVYLTRIHREFEGDVRFPQELLGEFRETEREDHLEAPLPFSFLVLDR